MPDNLSESSDFTFNEILERRGVNLTTCRIVRHDKRGLQAWRHSRACLENYFSYQKTKERSPYRGASIVFQFVSHGNLLGISSALFVGAYRVLDEWQFPEVTRQPDLHNPAFSSEHDGHEHMRYDLERAPEFEDLVARVLIDWGSSTRAWSQWPAKPRGDKPIIEIRAQRQDDPFPGFSEFQSRVDEVEFLPEPWQVALSSVAGVYLLVCPKTGEQYVGSAYGKGGFMERWRNYATNGHGGNLLLMGREKSNYAVSVLEIASQDTSAADIIHRETAWKNKLGSRSHGLNAN